MNKTLLLVIGLTLGACASTKKYDYICSGIDDYEETTVDTTIVWDDVRVSVIEVLYPNGHTIVLKIPNYDTKQLHLNDLENGTYTIKFQSEYDIFFVKTIIINN